MKRILCVVLAVLMLCSVCLMTGCEAKTLKLGMGVVAAYGSQTDADGETNGSGEANTTVVAVLLDDSGKIVKIDLDMAQTKLGWTAEGVGVVTDDLRTKYEKGTEYNMAAYGKKHDGSEGQPKEWFEQADAFVETVTGKTLDEAKALMGGDGYATGDLATAGCTINVANFMTALEKAVNNAKASEATAKDVLNVGVLTTASAKDATEEADGVVEAYTHMVAIAKNDKGEVTAAVTDAVQSKMTFDTTGASTLAATEAQTKLELGENYGMAAYGKKHDGSEGQPKEWFEQAAAFDAALVGLTADEFNTLMGADGYATGDLVTAGCTIGLDEMVETAVKAAK